MRSTPWYELILTAGIISWSVWFDRKRFITRLVAEAVWDYVNCPTRLKPRTDLERFADGLAWVSPKLDLMIYSVINDEEARS